MVITSIETNGCTFTEDGQIVIAIKVYCSDL